MNGLICETKVNVHGIARITINTKSTHKNQANLQFVSKSDVLKNHSNWLRMTLIAMNYAFMYKSILMPCHHFLNSNSYNED